jgi:hypothetical protein
MPRVALDITAPVAWGLVDAPPDLRVAAFSAEHAEGAAYGTLVVLTEGSTDAEFLAGAPEACHILRLM